jgi:hypothetical protein
VRQTNITTISDPGVDCQLRFNPEQPAPAQAQ